MASPALACLVVVYAAAGIPDFRSPETGLYANLQKYNLPVRVFAFPQLPLLNLYAVSRGDIRLELLHASTRSILHACKG